MSTERWDSYESNSRGDRGSYRRDDRGERSGGRRYSDRREQRPSRSRDDRGERDERRDSRRHDDRDYRDNRGYRDDRRDSRRYDDRRDFRDERPARDPRDPYDYIDFDSNDSRGYDNWDDDDDFEDAPYEPDRRDRRPERDSRSAYERRVEVRCPVAKRCGGCEWLAMPYEEQLELKQDYIEELFNDFKCEVEPIIGVDDPWNYRNKVQLPFAPGHPDREGRPTARWGIFERGSHRIVPCESCMVEDERARPIIATVAKLISRFNIRPFDEHELDGLLRYTLVRTAHVTGQVMVTLVCNGTRIPSEKAFIGKLLEEHPEITTIVLNTNTERTSVILGKEERVLYGPGYIEDELCGCRFRISSSSFYQTNPVAAEALYNLAVEMANLRPGDRMGDAYCGTGTIGIVAAKQSGARLLGVERNGDAVEDACINAEINGVKNAEFITGDAGSVFARMARAGEQLDVVFMDPPRAGSSQAFLANLSRLAPRRVVYISCEPKSQHHDILALVRNGYRVTRIRPVDMFPHTNHVENVVLLERKQHPRKDGSKPRRK